jgi:3-dehydroquinate dehydratase/shikimate dehydrogenase
MNNGKICVSVCAKTADELIEKIKRAESLADVIEIRFDCLDESEINKALSQTKSSKILLATFRSIGQGGKRDFTVKERLKFLESFLYHNKNSNFYLDFEFDRTQSAQLVNLVNKQAIASLHFWNEAQPDLNQTYYAMANVSKADIIKIAVQTNDITDTIPIWQLLKRAKSENKEIIPIAMGESGKWTRILGLAHGAFMTYASLDSEKETAPGQVTAKDLIEVYRAKELDEKTDVYGILGSNTSVSMSPYIHNTAFKFHKLNSVFVPLQVHNLDEFIMRMVKPETREVELNFKGFSVTIPHKQSIIKHLDFIDKTAEKVGAVNTVKVVDGKLHGYNTDAHGFIEPLKTAYGSLENVKVGVLGAGGAARACVYALKKEGADVTVFARDIKKASDLAKTFDVKLEEITTHHSQFTIQDILVNTTPLGMRGKAEGETPLKAEQMKNAKLVYDLVYIPFQTAFMQEADKAEVPKIGGMAMLVAQALEQQKIWTGLDAPMKEISAEVLKRL